MVIEADPALDAAEALLSELADLVAESDLLYDDEYDPEFDVDPTDGEMALDYGDTEENLNGLQAAAYALQAGMPVVSWKMAKKNHREREKAKRAARQFHAYAMAQFALYSAGKIDVATLNDRVAKSFRRQARNAFVAGRRAMGMMQAISPEDEATLQEILGFDEGNLSSIGLQDAAEHPGIIGTANNYYNEYTNVQMVQDWAKKAIGAEEDKKLTDYAKDVAPKLLAAGTGIGAAEKFDESLGYKEGWAQLSQRLGIYGDKVENAVHAGELNALDGLPGEAVLVWWELGDADHCDDCIALSDASPLYLSALDEQGIFPGSGHTQCGGNCHCSLNYEVPDQVCADGMSADGGDPSLALTESGMSGRINVWVQEAESCDNPVSVDSMDPGDADALDEQDAYSWDEDVQSTFEGEVDDSLDMTDVLASAEPAMIDLQKLFGFMDRMIPPDLTDVLRIGEVKDATSSYRYVWHDAPDAVHFHAGLVAKGPAALEHEYTLRAMSQLSQRAAAEGKAFVIDGKAASPGLQKWLDTLGAEHKMVGIEPPKVAPAFPKAYIAPKELFVPGRVTIGVSRMTPTLGTANSISDAEALRLKPAIHDAEQATTSDLKSLKIATEGQQPVIGRYTFEDVSGAEPSLQVELNAHKVTLADIDIANAYLVRRNLQDSTITTILGDDMKRLGLQSNGYLLRVTGLPVKKIDEVYDTVGKLVPVASIDAVHGIVEFSVFEGDVTPELKAGFQKIADSFPGSKLTIQDAHIRWYFHDAETRAATDYIHGPVGDLLTADEVKATYPNDLRTNAIRDPRGTLGSVAGGVSGTTAAAAAGYGLGAPEADLAALIAEPIHLKTSAADIAALDHEFEPLAKTWRTSLTATEHEAITQHQLDSGGFINDYLRKGSPQSLSNLHDALTLVHPTDLTTEELIAATDSAIAKGTIPDALSLGGSKDIVYRGIDKTGVPQIGDVLQDKGYLSTSFDPEKAAQFATQKSMPNVTYPAGTLPVGAKSVVYRYVLPKGHAAGIIDGEFVEGYSKEREVLLPRDEQFRVVRVRRDVEWINDAGEPYSLTVVDVVPEQNITYRKSEDWLKTVRPHFGAPDPSDLVLDPHTKLGGLTQKAIYVQQGTGHPASLTDLLGSKSAENLGPLDPAARRAFAEGLSRVQSVLPAAWNDFGGMAATDLQGALGRREALSNRIFVDAKAFSPATIADTIKTIKTQTDDGFFADVVGYDANTHKITFTDDMALQRVVVHEYGHVIDDAYSTGPIKDEWNAFWKAHHPQGLSGYAAQSEKEYRAEALTQALMGRSGVEPTALRGWIVAHGGGLPTDGTLPTVGEAKWLFKPKKVFFDDIGLSRDAANVEKTADYIYDALGVNVKAVEPYTADFPTKTGIKATGGNIQRLAPDLRPITDLVTDPAIEVVDALNKTQTTQLAQHQVADWLLGNDDGHIGQWMVDAKGTVVGIDKDAAIWEVASQMATGAVTMDDGKSYGRAIFDHVTAERLAKLDPAGIADVLNRADKITDLDYIERMRPVIATLMAHPNAVKLDEAGWIDIILKRKHELRHDVDVYYADKIAAAKRAGIELPAGWKAWDLQGRHFPAATDVKSALHYEAKGPPVDLPAGRGPVGLKPLDPQQYTVPGSPIPLNAPLPAWSEHVPDEPPLPKLKATPEEVTAAREEAHAVTRTVDGVIDGSYNVGISFTPEDSVKAEGAGLAYAKMGGVRVYAKTEADLAPLKDYLAVKGHSTFDHEFENLLGYSDEDIAKLDAYESAKKGYSLRAGAIVVEPDGRMWVLAPNNKFAGYANTWPKGGVDGLEGPAAAAVRELREETGLGIELDSFLGDYVNSDKTAISRMYIAHRVGGGPLYAAPTETYKIRLMTPSQAEKNLLRYGKPDPRDQAILKDALAALNGTAGDLQYVVPATDAADFHNAIATVKDAIAVPDGKPKDWPVIDFSPNPVALRPISAGSAFVFNPAAVADLMGKETDLAGSSTKFPLRRTVWQMSPTQKATMYWQPKGFGIDWANAKTQLDDPILRQTAHMAQLRKFGEMFEKSPTLLTLTVSNELLDQVPHLKDMIAGVGGYVPEAKRSALSRAQVATLLKATKGVAIDRAGSIVAVPTRAIDPVKAIVGRSKVPLAKVADALATVTSVAHPPAPPTTSLDDLRKIGNVKARKATFAALPEVERAVLADAVVTVPAAIDQIMAVAGPRPELTDPLDSVTARMKQVQTVDLVTQKQALDARSFTFSLRDYLYQAGVTDEPALRDLLLDTYDTLIAQENVTVGQVLGDHGIRHAIGDTSRAINTLAVVPGMDTPSDRAMMALAGALHDIGYLTPTGRMMLTADHPAWSMEAFNARFRPNLEKAFGKDWTDELAHIVETHDTAELDWVKEPRASAFRLADNLALFEADKMPALIAYVPANKQVLIDYAEGTITLPEAKLRMFEAIDAAFPGKLTPLSFQLRQAVDAVDASLPKFTIGMIGGRIGDIAWADGHVAVDLIRGTENEALSKVVDAGQGQFAKFAKTYNLDGKTFVTDGVFTFKNPDGTVALTARIETPKGVHVDTTDLPVLTDPDTQAIADQLSAVATTGPPFSAVPGETFQWTLPGTTVQPTTAWFEPGTTGNRTIIATYTHLAPADQLSVLAATLAKAPLGEAKIITLAPSTYGAGLVKDWATNTFHMSAYGQIDRADLEAWRAGLHADFVEHKIDPAIMDAIEHPEPVSHGPAGGVFTTKYGFKPDVVNGFVVDEGTTDAAGHLTQMVTGPGMANTIRIESSVSGDIFVWHDITGGGLGQAFRRQAALRYLRDVSHAFADDPALEVLLIRKEVVTHAGSDFRDLISEFTDQVGKTPPDFGLPRSTVLAIRDALDKETLPFEVPAPTPEAGIKALIGTAPGLTNVADIANGFKIERADWSSAVYVTSFHPTAIYSGGDATHLAFIADAARHQLADVVAMADKGVFDEMRLNHLDPELRTALLDRGASVIDTDRIRLTRAQMQSLAAEYNGTAGIGAIGSSFVKDIATLTSPADLNATIAVLDTDFKDYATNLSPWEKSALTKYQSAATVKDVGTVEFSALDVNDFLRDPLGPLWVGKVAEAQKFVDLMDAAIGKGTVGAETVTHVTDKTKEPFVVYRGRPHAPAAKVGDVITDPGYLSTSVDPKAAAQFTGYNDTPTLYRITVPPGMNAAWMNAVAGSSFAKEGELLLPRGQTWRVTAVSRNVSMTTLKGTTATVTIVDLALDSAPAKIEAIAAPVAKIASFEVPESVTKLVAFSHPEDVVVKAEELLPGYKNYSKGEIQLRRSVYGTTTPNALYGSVVWRRWGNRIEAWEVADAKFPAQVGFLNQTAKSMEAFPKIAYLRIIHPEDLHEGLLTMLKDAGGKEYSGGLRIERADLIKVRDALKDAIPAAAAAEPSVDALAPLTKYGLLGTMPGVDAVKAANALALATTTPDKYKFVWATYTSPGGLSARIVTRTSKTELWWRRVIPGPASSGFNTERAVLREWVRQGGAFDANPGWSRMRITGLKGLPKGFIQLLQDRGAQTIDGDTLHLERAKVLQLRDDIRAALGQTALTEAAPLTGAGADQLVDLLGGDGWKGAQYTPVTTKNLGIVGGWVAAFDATPFSILYGLTVPSGDLVVTGFTHTAVPQAEKGSAFGSFLRQAAGNKGVDIRLRQSVAAEFGELRDALIDAGAQWDKGELVLDDTVKGHLTEAFNAGTPLPKVTIGIKASDTKMSAQFAFPHDWVAQSKAQWNVPGGGGVNISIGGYAPVKYTFEVAPSSEVLTVHSLPGTGLPSNLAFIKAVMENVEFPNNPWLGGHLGLIKFPVAEWPQKTLDVLKASGGVVDMDGNLRMTVGNLSKLAAKITDDIGIEAPLLGSAATEAPLKVWPDIKAQIEASGGKAIDPAAYLNIPIAANTLSKGPLLFETSFPGVSYEWVRGSKLLAITDYHPLSYQEGVAGPAGMIAMLRHLGTLAVDDEKIAGVELNVKQLGSLQTSWLNEWGAKAYTETSANGMTQAFLRLDRDALLDLRAQVEAQFLEGGIPVGAVTSPALGAILHAANTTEEAVAKAGASWADVPGTVGGYHKAKVGGAGVTWWWSPPGTSLAWTDFNVLGAEDGGASALATLRHLLGKLEALPEATEVNFGNSLGLSKDMEQMLLDHGATKLPGLGVIQLPREKALVLLAELDKVAPAGMQAAEQGAVGLSGMANDAQVALSHGITLDKVAYTFADGGILYQATKATPEEMRQALFGHLLGDAATNLSSFATIDADLLDKTGTKAFFLSAGGVLQGDGSIAFTLDQQQSVAMKIKDLADIQPVEGVPTADAIKALDNSDWHSTNTPDSAASSGNAFTKHFADGTSLTYLTPDGAISYRYTAITGDTTVARATLLLKELQTDFPPHGGGYQPIISKAVLDSTGLKEVFLAYGATAEGEDVRLSISAAQDLASDITSGAFPKGGIATVAAVAPAVGGHLSVGQKVGIDLDTVKQTKFVGFSGGVKKKTLTFSDYSGGYYNSSNAKFTVNVLKDTYRLDHANYGYSMEAAQREASGYRALQVLASKATADGKGIAFTDDVLKEHPKVRTILETYGAKPKTLSSVVGKGLVLDAEKTGSLDSALFREKSGAIYEAKPTGSHVITDVPFSKQIYFNYNKEVADALTIETKPLAFPIGGLGKGTWMDASTALPNQWNTGTSYTVHLVYKIEHDPLGGVALTLGQIGYGQGNQSFIYRQLRDLLNDPDHPIDFVRFRQQTSGNINAMLQSLGATQDDITKEYILNHEQTKLLGASLKEDKVLWDPSLTAAVPEPAPIVPAPPPSTLSVAYGYPASAVAAMVDEAQKGNTSGPTSFVSKTLSVGKHGPSLQDRWNVPGMSVDIKWSFDDHKGTKIAHIRQVIGVTGGTAAAQTSSLLAELQHQFAGNFFVSNPWSPLSRVIIDKKALGGMPKMEQLLKDAGWKETKAYYTTDKAGLNKLVDEVKANTAPWQKVSAIPYTVAAVPAGAGAAIEDQTSTLVLPGKVGKVAAPSFIYGYDKGALDTAYGSLVSADLGTIQSVGDVKQQAQTYELTSGLTTGKWSISPSGKTVGWFEFTGTGDSVADAPAAFAMLRKIAEDAQNRTTDFWVKPEVYDKVVGLRQMLLDAGGAENPYPNIGTAIKMPAKNAASLVQSLSGDVMSGLTVSIEHPAEYLGFDHVKALELFETEPVHAVNGAAESVTFDLYKVGPATAQYKTKDRTVTWLQIGGVPGTAKPLATVATIQWFNEQGVPTLIVSKAVLTSTPKLAQFLVASGGKVIGDTVSLDATALNNAAKFLNKEHLPEMLGGAKLPYSIVDDMAAKSSAVISALHAETVETDGLTRVSRFLVSGATVRTDWTRSADNIYWRSMGQNAASVGATRAAAVAQLRSFVTDLAENANLARLDVDARVFNDIPHLRDVLARYGATEHTEGGATFWSLDRGRAMKLREVLDKDLGDILVAPVGYAVDQARLINWPSAEALTLANPDARAALGGQTRKAIFRDKDGNEWLFKPGASGRGAATDAATSELALRLGLPVPTAHIYTLNVAAKGDPEKLVQGSLYKMLPKVEPVNLSTLTPAQVQDVMRHSVLDWVVANDDAHAGNYLINAADGKVWAIDKSRAWVTFHGAQDVLNRASEGNLGGTPLLFKFFREAVADPEKLRLIHPTTIGITLRHLQEISDDEFKRIVGPVVKSLTENPRYKGRPEKFLEDMLARKHGAASDFEGFFRTQIKDALDNAPGKVPDEWKTWLSKGGTFDLTATPQDLWKERMADLDSKYGTYSAAAVTQKLEQSVFEPIRSEIRSYFGGGATGHASNKYGSELIRPRLSRKGMDDALKEWQDLNQWGLLHIVSGEAGPQSHHADEAFRKFWNPDTGTFRITHSTSRYGSGSNPQAYLDGMNRDGVRNLIGTAVGTHVVVAGGGGVYYYIDLPYDQAFSAWALGYGHGQSEMEMLAADVRPEQVIAIRNQNSPMDLTKLMDYQGPVISKAA